MVFALDNNTYVETILPTNVGNDSQKCNVFAKQVKFEDNTTLTTAPNTSYDETTRLGNGLVWDPLVLRRPVGP